MTMRTSLVVVGVVAFLLGALFLLASTASRGVDGYYTIGLGLSGVVSAFLLFACAHVIGLIERIADSAVQARASAERA